MNGERVEERVEGVENSTLREGDPLPAGTSVGPLILVTNDDPANRKLLAAIFRAEGLEVILAEDGESALARVAESAPAVVLMDLGLPGIGGMEALARLRASAPQVPVIMITSDADIPTAIEATRLGAYDFLTRPLNNDVLVLTVRRALERFQLGAELRQLKRRLDASGVLSKFTGISPQIVAVAEQIERVADSTMSVVVVGETGTGKELVARAVHQSSSRRDQPFVPVDCGAIPENLLESELFGYEKGAFTGADRRKPGLFQVARGGSVFLDEVGNLPPATQAKLLRAIQERQIQPLGGTSTVAIDVRFIAATNQALETQVAAGHFRADLYYRLAEYTIKLPSLRERLDDIIPLAGRFAEEASIELRRHVAGLSDGATALLRRHSWPGNVRELRNVIRQAVLNCTGLALEPDHFQHLLANAPPPSPAVPSIPVSLDGSLKDIASAATSKAEKEAILEALRITRGNKRRAAQLLHIDNKTLHVKINRYGVRGSNLI